MMVLLCSAIVFGALRTSSWDPGWIYYPPLHENLVKKDLEKQRKERETQQRIDDEATACRRNSGHTGGWSQPAGSD